MRITMIWTTLYSTFSPIIATATDVSQSGDPTFWPALLGFGSNALTGILTYVVTTRKYNKQSSRRDINDLIEANNTFREEVKKELEQAKTLIEELKKQLNKKEQDMIEMQSSIADLKNQISIRETSISELNTQIMKRDIKIAGLEARVDKMANQ